MQLDGCLCTLQWDVIQLEKIANKTLTGIYYQIWQQPPVAYKRWLVSLEEDGWKKKWEWMDEPIKIKNYLHQTAFYYQKEGKGSVALNCFDSLLSFLTSWVRDNTFFRQWDPRLIMDRWEEIHDHALISSTRNHSNNPRRRQEIMIQDNHHLEIPCRNRHRQLTSSNMTCTIYSHTDASLLFTYLQN